MDPDKQKAMFDMADKFIHLANEIANSDKSANVTVAIRYAAARYCAYEASMLTENLADDKDKQLQLYTDDFRKMLRVNLEDYIAMQSKNRTG